MILTSLVACKLKYQHHVTESVMNNVQLYLNKGKNYKMVEIYQYVRLKSISSPAYSQLSLRIATSSTAIVLYGNVEMLPP